MADDTSASVITLHQPWPARAKTPAERAKAYRLRKKAHRITSSIPAPCSASLPAVVSTPVTLLPPENVTLQAVTEPREAALPTSRRQVAPALLAAAAVALALVGMTMNGWFARSLGSTETSGWLFLAIGIAADLVALVIPSVAAGLWQTRQRATALAGWGVWLLTFIFAITASIGFASVNISDVTTSRSSRVTPAVMASQAALADAMASRDRECRGGVGKFCREREAAVAERRQAVEAAMHGVEQTADPQTEAAIRVVAWASLGALRPTENDFSMLRLVLLALLPQIGGVVLMIGRIGTN
jgi:hypothetical protein